jgi:hypothetical protein
MNFASTNQNFQGGVKRWIIYSEANYLLAIKKMEEINFRNKGGSFGKYTKIINYFFISILIEGPVI